MQHWAKSIAGLSLWVLTACATTHTGTLQLVETTPVGTVLGSPDLPETADVWREMIAGAKETIELSHFYLVSDSSGLLSPIVTLIEEAAARGVRVRFLVGEKFYSTYPELIDRFAENPDIQLRRLNLAERTGGVQHSKYMVVDGEDVYVGSANFDWRSLEHIQELGVRITSPGFARTLLDVFAYDWAMAGGEPIPAPVVRKQDRWVCLMDRDQMQPRFDRKVEIEAAFSPKDLLPNEATWDLPKLVELIDSAEYTLFLQVLTLDLVDRGGRHFQELEDALERASERGVRIRVLVADWSDRAGVIEDLQQLAALPKISIRMVSIPEHTSGHIPFARVIHAKYLVADRRIAWLGSSNWERGYFFESRNVGLILRGDAFADRLERFFRTNWGSPYVRDVLPVAAPTNQQP
ncbi:MAG TPA: phospholipase D-like domain-containing protein [Planctomycetota bacterium]|nr:phospholipase D-like domain-containing protein [Planctomycetota bacterium]HRV80392.1 phospholipase D-like domain-containing protein [Planctomycetota bacterium]